MNRKFCFLLAGALWASLLLTACSPKGEASPPPSEASPTASSGESQTPAPSGTAEVTTPSQQPSDAPAPDRSESPAPSPSGGDAKELALTFIDKSVEELIAAIGEPISSDYAPSCLGAGEDGELVYDGFSVYTYREGDVETVRDVL